MNTAKWFPLLVLAALSGCDKLTSTASPGLSEARSRELVPQQPEIAAIYARSCRSCHTVAATGAPLTGDQDAWAPRLDKGMGVLLESVINGYGGMPPFGLCMDCSAEQFEALIRFMADGSPSP
ncbi:MAG: c-type cytochrome [Halioglobus sp.]